MTDISKSVRWSRESSPVGPFLRVATRRATAVRAVRWMLQCGGAAALASAFGVAALRLSGSHLRVAAYAPVVVLIVIVVTGAVGCLRPPTTRRVAGTVDFRSGSHERLLASLDLEHTDFGTMRETLLRETEQFTRGVDLTRVLPMPPLRSFAYAVVALLVLTGALLIPVRSRTRYQEGPAERAEVVAAGHRLVAAAIRDEVGAKRHGLAATAHAAAELRRFALAMQKGAISKEHALVGLQKLTRAVQQRQHELANGSNHTVERQPAPARSQAMRALQSLRNALAQRNSASAKASLQALQQAAASGQLNQDQLAGLTQDMQQMMQQLTPGKSGDGKAGALSDLLRGSGLTPEDLKRIMSQMVAGSNGSPMPGMVDAEALSALIQELKEGRAQLAWGGKGPGALWGGTGGATHPLAHYTSSKARLTEFGQARNAEAASSHNSNFLKYAAMRPGVHRNFPNAMVKGSLTQSSAEQFSQSLGDPGAGFNGNEPLYSVPQAQSSQAANPTVRERIPAQYRDQVKAYFRQIR